MTFNIVTEPEGFAVYASDPEHTAQIALFSYLFDAQAFVRMKEAEHRADAASTEVETLRRGGVL